MSINKWLLMFSLLIFYEFSHFVSDLYSIIVHHHFEITMPLDVLMLFYLVATLEDMLDFKRFLKEKGH